MLYLPDPAGELYEDFNEQFARYWKEKTGQDLTVRQSHGGSGKQALVIHGLGADVVTLALAYDIDDYIATVRPPPATCSRGCPIAAPPYTSTIVLLTRKGNPKGIKDWGDLAKPGVSVITPYRKTSGGARWNFLAGVGLGAAPARRQRADRQGSATGSTRTCRCLTPAPGLTTTFVERGIGDVLIAWKTRRCSRFGKPGPGKFEVAAPVSILAEPPVAVAGIGRQARHQGGGAGLPRYLYTDVGQEIAAKHFDRPRNPAIAAKNQPSSPSSIWSPWATCSAGWKKAQEVLR